MKPKHSYENLNFLTEYKQFIKLLEDSTLSIGFECANGKRLISNFQNESRCVALDNRMRIVSDSDYKSNEDLVFDYFKEESEVVITKICFFEKRSKAISWLLGSSPGEIQ
jgi:hypothetical protein